MEQVMAGEGVPFVFKLGHGLFNIALVFMFSCQALLGIRIRRARLQGQLDRYSDIRRQHRRNGAIIAPLGLLGFLAGGFLVFLDEGKLLEYPPHFLNGLLIAILIGLVFMASRGISAIRSPWRRRHAALGGVLMLVYLLQVFSGIWILLGSGS